MSQTYRLKYFDFMGIAEPIRYLLEYSGTKYENIQINRDENWDSVKKTVPFGKLPVLEINGKVLYQSVTISRYLGKQLNVTPGDEFEQAELDAIAETVFDFGTQVHDYYHETDPKRKSMLFKELGEVTIPRYCTEFENIAQKKGTYFGGKNVSWADLYFVGVMESIQGMLNKDILQKQYKRLHEICVNVQNIPAIKNYISKRPRYKY